MTTQLLLLAKEPLPGRVKTRLCPPATPEQAAQLAAAALADTLDVLAATPAARRLLVLAGASSIPVPAGVEVYPQRGAGLGDRLANAYHDTLAPGVASLLIGMDTPQVTRELLTAAADQLSTVDVVIGPATDGGWWALGLRDPRHAEALRDVPMSTSDTGRLTVEALRGRGLRCAMLPELRDVDTAADALAVAADLTQAPGRFAGKVRAVLTPAAA